jgi:hypothetical protein
LGSFVFISSLDLPVFSGSVVESKDPAGQLLIFDRKSTLDGFCDGSSAFLKLSQLLSIIHPVDNSSNVQECFARINAMHTGTRIVVPLSMSCWIPNHTCLSGTQELLLA